MSIIVNKNGGPIDSNKAPIQKVTASQNAWIVNNWKTFEKNQVELGQRAGVPYKAEHGASMAGNAFPVLKDQWGQWAKTGIELQRSILGVFNDIASTNTRGVPIGKLVDYFQTISDSSEDVNFSIDGRGKAKTDQPVLDYHGTPIGIYDNNCSFGWRQMETMMQDGGAGNLQQAAMNNKMRHMMERLENMVLNGENVDVGGAKVYGLLNHPQRNTQVHGITLNGATPAEIKGAVIATLKAAHVDNFKTGFTLYLNWDDYFYMQSYQYGMAVAQGQPTATGANRLTIEQELLNIPGVERIVATDSVPTNTIIALVKSTEVVEMLSAMPVSMRPKFRANPEDDYVFINMAAQAVQLKFDNDGKMGLAVGTQA